LDSGVDVAHPFLSGKVVSQACYSSTTTSTVTLCPDGSEASTAPGSGAPCSVVVDDCAHGTHVAGIAVGKGATFSGVGRDASLISIQVFSHVPTDNTIVAFFSDIILALERVYALRNSFSIAAVNLSLSGETFTAPCDSSFGSIKAAIDNLHADGIPTIVAAGNDGFADRLGTPACISTAISVAATSDGGTGATPVDQVLGFQTPSRFSACSHRGASSSRQCLGAVFPSFKAPPWRRLTYPVPGPSSSSADPPPRSRTS
jgi:hypothetical protein